MPFLGTTMGADRRVIEYDVHRKAVTAHHAGGTTEELGSIFDVLDRELARHTIDSSAGLPRGLLGGFVGYLGYECKADCGSPNVHRSDVPDAVLMFANRVVAVDHVAHRTHLAALCDEDGDADADAERWLADAEAVVRDTLAQHAAGPAGPSQTPGEGHTAGVPGVPWPSQGPGEGHAAEDSVTFRCGRGREQYLADIARCQVALAAGESYEVCLTDQIHTDASPEPFALYRLLRRRNPAPFAAYLKLGEMAVMSSSPERFIAIDRDRNVQARPIKGTTARSADPQRDEALRDWLLHDEKTFAEHLMIVDLLRNDLGRVCEIDTVRVPQFMVVEPYTTVHQLISTITGVLERERTPVDCVRRLLPGRLDDGSAEAAHDGASSTTSSGRRVACTRGRSATSQWTAAST